MKAIMFSIITLLCLVSSVFAEPVALDTFSILEIQLPASRILELDFDGDVYEVMAFMEDNQTVLTVGDQEFMPAVGDIVYVDVDGNDIADFAITYADTFNNIFLFSFSRNIGRVDVGGARPQTSDFTPPPSLLSQDQSSTDLESVAVVGTIIVIILAFLVFQELRRHHHKHAHHPVHNETKAEVAVIDYIKRHRNKGIPMSEIRKKLESVGWSKELLEEAFTKLK